MRAQESDASILNMIDGKRLLREATLEDCTMLFEWANDPDVRIASFWSEPIERKSHVAWLEKKLADPSCFIYIASNEDRIPFGQVRFDLLEDGRVEIHLHTAKERRAKGYGAPLITTSLDRLFSRADVHTVHAYVRIENVRSIRVFEKAGFTHEGEMELKGHTAHHYVFHRS